MHTAFITAHLPNDITLTAPAPREHFLSENDGHFHPGAIMFALERAVAEVLKGVKQFTYSGDDVKVDLADLWTVTQHPAPSDKMAAPEPKPSPSYETLPARLDELLAEYGIEGTLMSLEFPIDNPGRISITTVGSLGEGGNSIVTFAYELDINP